MGFKKYSNIESLKVIDPDNLEDKEKLELKKTFDFSCDEELKDSEKDSEKSN